MADDPNAPDYEQVQRAYDALFGGDIGACFEELKRFLGRKGLLTAEDRLGNAERIVKDHYHTNDVTRIADNFAKEWRAGEFRGSREAAVQAIEEACDNACTYYHDACMVIAYSENRNACVQELGEAPHDGVDIHWTSIATMALRADVIEHLNDVDDIDINNEPPSEPIIDCDACGEWKPGEGDICNDCRADAGPDGGEWDEGQQA